MDEQLFSHAQLGALGFLFSHAKLRALGLLFLPGGGRRPGGSAKLPGTGWVIGQGASFYRASGSGFGSVPEIKS